MLARKPRRTRFLNAAILSSLAAGLLPVSDTRAQVGARPNGPIHQLRIYEIFDSNKAAFHERFRDHATRIMRRHGFDIVAMWEAKSPGRTEFVYVLAWPDESAMDARWAAFMADKEWAAIKAVTAAEHGQLVGEIESRVLRLTSYSAKLGSEE